MAQSITADMLKTIIDTLVYQGATFVSQIKTNYDIVYNAPFQGISPNTVNSYKTEADGVLAKARVLDSLLLYPSANLYKLRQRWQELNMLMKAGKDKDSSATLKEMKSLDISIYNAEKEVKRFDYKQIKLYEQYVESYFNLQKTAVQVLKNREALKKKSEETRSIASTPEAVVARLAAAPQDNARLAAQARNEIAPVRGLPPVKVPSVGRAKIKRGNLNSTGGRK